MEKLFAIVDEVSSSINEMSVASQQVAENVEILSSSTEVTASSITELDASIKEIEENAEKTNQLSEEAARDAEQGKKTVNETIEGIVAIREMVDRASGAILELGNQSSAIVITSYSIHYTKLYEAERWSPATPPWPSGFAGTATTAGSTRPTLRRAGRRLRRGRENPVA